MEKFNMGDMFKSPQPKEKDVEEKNDITEEKPILKANKGLENIGEKIASKATETIERNRKLRDDDNFQNINQENKEAMKGSSVIAVLGPLLGMIGGPMFAIFNMGLDDAAVKLLGSVIVGNLIGNLIGGGISWANLRNTVNNRTKMTYLYVQNLFSEIKYKATSSDKIITELKSKNKKLETENKTLNEELTAYKIKEQAEEMAKKIRNERSGPHA